VNPALLLELNSLLLFNSQAVIHRQAKFPNGLGISLIRQTRARHPAKNSLDGLGSYSQSSPLAPVSAGMSNRYSG
jgi:hypothetical protein